MESGVVGGGMASGGMASEGGGLATSWRLAAGMASGRGREPGGGDLGAGRGRCRSWDFCRAADSAGWLDVRVRSVCGFFLRNRFVRQWLSVPGCFSVINGDHLGH
jgi:hypothetical protein